MALKYLLIFLSIVCFVFCEKSSTNGTEPLTQEQISSHRTDREIGSYIGLIGCAMKYDVSCLVNVAEDYLEVRRTELLAEADSAAFSSTGRSDPESRPSHIANTLSRLVSELVNMFQNGVSGFFKSGREAADDDYEEEESDENELTDSTTNGESRGKKKKKKKKLYSLLKLLTVGVIIYKKVCLILKLFHAALQFKFFLLAIGGLLLHAIKFWLILKKDNHPTKVIYYEHAQHQHHYGHGEEDGHSLWARALNDPYYINTTDLGYQTLGHEQRALTGIKKKKKKKPLKSLIKLIKVALIALIIVLKLAILLKVLQTAMQFKFLLISVGGFAIQVAKLWMSVRNKKDHGHEEIVYKNPYSAGDEYSSPGGAPYGGEYNAARSAQELVYSLQRSM